MYIKRTIEVAIKRMSSSFPVVLITGPRQVGKTTVLQNMAQERNYVSLDDLDNRRFALENPTLFFERFPPPLLIDEIQYAPDLFSAIKVIVDREKKPGMFWITGSQKFHLMKNVSESLAGRVGVLDLEGLSLPEINKTPLIDQFVPTKEWIEQRAQDAPFHNLQELYEIIWRGSFPGLYSSNQDWEDFYSSYIRTYIERDIHDLHKTGDEIQFMALLTALATRSGQLLNYSDLARNLGKSMPTIKRWISVLETTGLIFLLYPFSQNLSNRMTKLPKIYFMDTGIICYLSGWLTPETLERGGRSGEILETFVIAEIIKTYLHNGRRPRVSFYRDKDQREIDLIIEANGKVYPIEIKKKNNPISSDIRHFSVLEDNKLDVGEGAVICCANSHRPLTERVNIIPVSYI